MTIDEILTVSFTLFAVIDIIGSIPLLLSLKEKMGGINELKASLISGGLMIFFLFVGEKFLSILGVDVKSFAVGGSIVIFILGLEMVLGIEFFKGDSDPKSGTVVPIAFPLIAGAGTMTTLLSLKAQYSTENIVIAILFNIIVVYVVLKSSAKIEKMLGKNGLGVIRKTFGIVLLAIAVKLFASNVKGLFM